MNSPVDVPAFLLAVAMSAIVTAVLVWANRGENRRRLWIVAGALAVVLGAIAVLDLMRESPRETHVVTAVLGPVLAVLGGVAGLRWTRRVSRVWLRGIVAFVATFVLLFAGLLIGATVLPRYLP